MKSINRALIVAAIGTALSGVAFAQSPGAGAASPNPSTEETTTTPSDSRTQQGRPGIDRPAAESTNRSPNSGSVQDRDVYREDASKDGDVQSTQKKRSFWDRILGRNKPADAENTREGIAPTDTDASGRRRDRAND